MIGQRLAYISISAVALIGVLIWVVRSPTRSTATVADEPISLDLHAKADRAAISELPEESTEATKALADAQAEIERLKAELAAEEASLDGRKDDGIVAQRQPRGYSGAARAFADEARSVFDNELIDASWAPAAQSELYDSISKQIVNDGLYINLVEVRCKTDACRVQMSFSQPPATPSALGKGTAPAVELSRQIAKKAKSVSFSGLIQIRGNFPGQPTTAELFLFRSGNDGISYAMQTPKGTMLLCAETGCSPGAGDEVSGQ